MCKKLWVIGFILFVSSNSLYGFITINASDFMAAPWPYQLNDSTDVILDIPIVFSGSQEIIFNGDFVLTFKAGVAASVTVDAAASLACPTLNTLARQIVFDDGVTCYLGIGATLGGPSGIGEKGKIVFRPGSHLVPLPRP